MWQISCYKRGNRPLHSCVCAASCSKTCTCVWISEIKVIPGCWVTFKKMIKEIKVLRSAIRNQSNKIKGMLVSLIFDELNQLRPCWIPVWEMMGICSISPPSEKPQWSGSWCENMLQRNFYLLPGVCSFRTEIRERELIQKHANVVGTKPRLLRYYTC